nr:MAG TPA: hypothetical protein [Caudoviricetes sp.]
MPPALIQQSCFLPLPRPHVGHAGEQQRCTLDIVHREAVQPF